MIGLARWCCTAVGGVLLGAGVVLHGQVALARFMREEVDNTFFLWRWIGKATFSFQGGETRLALAMAEVPPEALATSDKAAWTLVLLGSAVAVVGPLLGGARGKISKPRSRRSRAARP